VSWSDIDSKWLGVIGTALAGGFVWLRTQRRGVSGDNAAIAEDKAKTGLISRLERLADETEARAAAAETRERALADELAEARAAVRTLRRDLARQVLKKEHRTKLLSEEEQRILKDDTGMMGLDDDGDHGQK
jgi:hypothetical protein